MAVAMRFSSNPTESDVSVDRVHPDDTTVSIRGSWLLKKLQVQSLVDNQDVEIDAFDLLVDGGMYTLGPPIQQQQQVSLQ